MNSDTRAIYVRDGVFYTSKAKQDKGDNICRFCFAREICTLPEASECRDFMPILWFREPAEGLSGAFSTFRLGAAWIKRLKVGDIVGIALTGSKKKLNYAEVTKLDSGRYKDMIRDHAHTNHIIQARGVSKLDAPKELDNIVRRFYGPNLLSDPEKTCCVIHMRVKEDDEEGKGLGKTWPVARKRKH